MFGRRARHLALPLALGLVVAAGCTTNDGRRHAGQARDHVTTTSAPLPEGAPASDPAAPGPHGTGRWQTMVADHTSLEGATVPLAVEVWYPTDGPAGPFPLVVFSHGASSQPTASSFLTEYLSTHGFVVAAAQHPVERDRARRVRQPAW